MNDVHIMNYLSETEPLDFEFMQALKYADESELERALARADYLVIPLVNETSFPYPSLDPDFFQSFSPKPVFQVIRGRGIYEMPVIQVFRRVPSVSQNIAQ
jgi:hypothetical protein